MSRTQPGRVVILTGPSCVCKSPLARALKRFYPELMKPLQPIVLFNSRPPRPGETDGVDYHFRGRQEIADLRENSRYVVMGVRGDLQALDLENLAALLKKCDAFYESVHRPLAANPRVA